MKQTFTLILLTAGKSERMGVQKADLMLNGNSFFDRIISEYNDSKITKQISVINNKLKVKGESIVNNMQEKGRIYSLQLGLENAESDWYFIQNIDNPFVTTELLNQLISCSKVADIIQPTFNKKKGHPILISNKVKEEILSETNYKLTLRDVFSKFSKQQIEVDDDSILININTPEDYQKYCIEKVN